jgi:hypothetical protein
MGDENMLKYKAIQMAYKSYNNKFVEKTNLTNLGSDDPSTGVLAGLLAKYELSKAAVGS